MAVIPGTDSYGDETGLAAYAAARGITIVGNQSQLLIKAMDWLESQGWSGQKYLLTQPLEFPRYPLVYTDDTAGVVPARIIKAQYMIALLIDGGDDMGAVLDRAIKRENIARTATEVEYQDNSGAGKIYSQLLGLVGRYMSGGGGTTSFLVVRV